MGSRRNVRHNLAVLAQYSGRELDTDGTTREVFSNFARSIYFFLRLPFIPREELVQRCDYSGLDRLLADLTRSSGVILAGPHLGPWEVGGACIAALGIGVQTVALPHPSRRVTRFFERRRQSVGVGCTAIGGEVTSLVQALRHGKCIALLVDRAYGLRSMVCNFLGKPMVLPAGHLALAVRCSVPVVPTACVFDGDHKFRFLYGGPHYPRRDLDHRSAMEELQQRCVDDMERFIVRHPEQWFQFVRV